jgi:hypothetical protein
MLLPNCVAGGAAVALFLLGSFIIRTLTRLHDAAGGESATAYEYGRDRSTLKDALLALVQRGAGRRLARLGGSEPGLEEIPRRRSGPA